VGATSREAPQEASQEAPEEASQEAPQEASRMDRGEGMSAGGAEGEPSGPPQGPVYEGHAQLKGAHRIGDRETRQGCKDSSTSVKRSAGPWQLASPALPLAPISLTMHMSTTLIPDLGESMRPGLMWKPRARLGLLWRGLALLLCLLAWAPQRCAGQDVPFPNELASPPPSVIFQGDCKHLQHRWDTVGEHLNARYTAEQSST